MSVIISLQLRLVFKATASRLVFRRGRTTGVARQIRQRRAQWKRRPAAQQDCSEPQNAVAWGSSGPALAAYEAMARNFPTGADRRAIVACRNRRAGARDFYVNAGTDGGGRQDARVVRQRRARKP